MRQIICFLLLFMFTGTSNVNAQSKYIGGIFPTIDHTGKISKTFDYGLYYFGAFPFMNLKKSDSKNDVNLLLLYLEQSLTLNLNDKLQLSGSYVYQRENVFENNFINENRIHIQATYKHPIKNIILKNRIRFDNRFIKNRITGETPYTHRVRYLIGLDFPYIDKHNKYYITLYEELFINTFNNASIRYAENWAYAGVGLILNNQNKIEAGPLYITWNVGDNDWYHQYYAQLTWISKFNFNNTK
ncbi:MAG: DUF2490 domain-containing protein [Bacteroidota bacterium]